MSRSQLSMKVLERALSDSELNDLIKKYDENKKTYTTANRFEYMKKDLTPEEVRAMKLYLDDEGNKPVRRIAEEMGMKEYNFQSMLLRAMKKFMYQNRGLIK